MEWSSTVLAALGSLRALGILLALPTLGGRPIPATVRAGLSILLGGLMVGAMPLPAAATLPATLPGWLAAALQEVVLGLAMGLIGRMVISAAELAGRIVAGEVGLIAAPGFDAPTPASEPLPTFWSIFAGVLFFGFDAHHGILAAYARSFALAPIGQAGLSPAATSSLVRSVAELIELALRMAAPFIALNFVITLAFAILGRAVPKMNVFVVSFSLKSLLGLTLLASAGGLIASYLFTAFEALPWRMLEVVVRR